MDKFERAVKALNITVVQINVLSNENGGSATLRHVTHQHTSRPSPGTQAVAAGATSTET